MRWCQSLSSIDSDQSVLLYRDVELQEARLLQAQLRTPEHPWWDALTHPLPYVDLSAIDGVVLGMKHARPSYNTETEPHPSNRIKGHT